MKRKFFAAFLSLCMVMSLVPMTALAAPENDGARTPSTQAATELPGAVDGVITLKEDVTLSTAYEVTKGNVIIDLAGYTLAYDGTGNVFLDVQGGSLTIRDSGGNGEVKVDEPYDGTGTGGKTQWIKCVQVHAGATFTLEGGTLTNTNTAFEATQVISNYGTTYIEGGTVKGVTGIFIYNPVRGNDEWTGYVSTCNVFGGRIEGVAPTTYQGNNKYGEETVADLNWSYGIAIYGPGVDSSGAVDNTKSVLNITDGTITAGQAIGTNASSGRYAGYTINMSGGTVDGGTGTGMYLPAIGKTNISGGKVTAAQAIRICAGELNVTGGTITCTAVSDNSDLIAGGSGGTLGAIVVGKASNGYVGDIVVNVSGSAVVQNTADKTGSNDVYPTIVVSDKNMALASDQYIKDPATGNDTKETFKYSETSTSVTVNATIKGDIVKISNLTQSSTTQDGGKTSLDITGGTVTGDVINQTTEGDLDISGSTITGNVTNKSKGEVVISNNSKIDGTVSNTGTGDGDEKGSMAILDSTVDTVAENQEIVLVNTTVGNSTEPITNTGDNVAMIGAKTYETLEEAIDAAQNGDTITLLKSFTVNTEQNSAGSGAYNISGRKLTIDGNNCTITAGAGFSKNEAGTRGEYHIFNITDGANVTIRDLTIDGKSTMEESVPRSGINVYANDGATSPTATLINVEIKNCSTYGVTVADATVEATDLKTSGNNWGGVNVDPRTNDGKASFTLNGENSRLEDTSNGIKIDNTYSGSNSEAANVIVNDGYVSSITEDSGNDDSSTAITVNGGSFGESVAEYVTDSLKAELNHSGTYTYYSTVEEALENAKPGDQITALGQTGGEPAEPVTVFSVAFKSDLGTVPQSYNVTGGTSIKLPTLPNQGYNHFQGWKSSVDGKTYDAAEEVSITANTTFTAVWNYIPPANPNYKITIGDMENGTVTANPTAAKAGATVTLTPVPDEGYALSTLTVTDRFGDAVRVTEQADGTYTFPMPNGQVTVTATFVQVEEPAPTEPFVDVNEGDWFYDAVVYAYQNELMDGVGGNRFAPNSETTRAQLVTILYRLEGQPAVSGDLPFTDVEAGIWYTDAILWAAQNNIVNGVSDTEFAPGDDLTRQQLVTILYRYAESKGYDVSASADLSGYPDAGQVQDYAQPAMAWAVAENIIQGMEDGTLKPAGNASRAQIATILMRFCEDVAQ